MGVPLTSSTMIPAFLLMCYLHMGSVQAFVSFLPTSTSEESAEGFDSFEPAPLADSGVDDKLVYRLLYNVILDKLHSMEGADSDFIPRPSDAEAYKTVKRNFDRMPALERMHKRKVFWQPIGFLPSKVSSGGNKGGSAAPASSSHNQPGQPFRYG